ncbi:D-alanyl-D-alanine dipeptidase [bacterium]|nr:D-alanyl-D-alanine dipeptidase [bacterium]
MKKIYESLKQLLHDHHYDRAKRVLVTVFGFTFLLIGLAMIFLPGPALIVIPASLALLGTEFVWARRFLRKFRQEVNRVRGIIFSDKSKEPLVDVEEVDPTILVDIRYATTNNFTGKILYPSAKCLLRQSVAEKLSMVQQELLDLGYGLKIWDAYRPHSIQKILWDHMPDERYVCHPHQGSMHNRGAAVDVTLVDKDGNELEMPTAFDEFCEKAHRSYQNLPPPILKNRQLLEGMMKQFGFTGLATEWWHFNCDGGEHYSILDTPLDNKI